MEQLILEKLSEVKELKCLTEEILSISLKNDYYKVNKLIDERQANMDNINTIIRKIDKLENKEYTKSNSIKSLEKEIKDICIEIYCMDNLIRKNINIELDNIRKNLNKPNDYSKMLNIKA